jgi:putative transposase
LYVSPLVGLVTVPIRINQVWLILPLSNQDWVDTTTIQPEYFFYYIYPMLSDIEFFTATCLNWNNLLTEDKRKDIIIDSMRFLVNDKRIWLYGFVIMPNHIHLLWSKQDEWLKKNIQLSFMKYTAQQLKFHLLDTGATEELALHKSTQADREYQFWERRPWKARMPDRETIEQKLHYIHINPVTAGLCAMEEEYKYSSCAFYYDKPHEWDFLTHYLDHC